MSLATLSTANLNNLIALVKKREALQIELTNIEEQIQAAVSPGASASAPKATPGRKARGRKKAVVEKAPAPAVKPSKPAKAAKKGKRGALKEAILEELKAAGSKGVAVKDLSATLGVKNQNLHVWFATTGKTVKGLKKTGTGTWAYAG